MSPLISDMYDEMKQAIASTLERLPSLQRQRARQLLSSLLKPSSSSAAFPVNPTGTPSAVLIPHVEQQQQQQTPPAPSVPPTVPYKLELDSPFWSSSTSVVNMWIDGIPAMPVVAAAPAGGGGTRRPSMAGAMIPERKPSIVGGGGGATAAAPAGRRSSLAVMSIPSLVPPSSEQAILNNGSISGEKRWSTVGASNAGMMGPNDNKSILAINAREPGSYPCHVLMYPKGSSGVPDFRVYEVDAEVSLSYLFPASFTDDDRRKRKESLISLLAFLFSQKTQLMTENSPSSFVFKAPARQTVIQVCI